MKDKNMKEKFYHNADNESKINDKKRKEILKKYHYKVKNAEVRKHERHHNIIEKK